MAAKIKFEFKESRQFRIVHADGVFGGPTPRGDIYVSFFNDRQAMPTSVSHVLDGNRIGPEVMEDRKVADALERTMEVALVMNLDTAIIVRDWLSRNITTLQQARGEMEVIKQ